MSEWQSCGAVTVCGRRYREWLVVSDERDLACFIAQLDRHGQVIFGVGGARIFPHNQAAPRQTGEWVGVRVCGWVSYLFACDELPYSIYLSLELDGNSSPATTV